LGRTADLIWATILGGSLLAIGVGFAGGRHYGTTALRPVPLPAAIPPAEIRPRTLDRALRGSGSFDAGDDDPDPYGDPDHAVATRPAGWAPPAFDERHERPRVAVLVVGADRAAAALAPFLAEPFPLAVAITPDLGAPALRAAREAGKTALVDCGGADLGAIVALRRAGAAGIVCSTADPARADALLAANRDGFVFDDLVESDALYRAARAHGRPAVSRDVVADARDESAYVDFLFAQALAIARRTGVATVAVHARPGSLRALERFAARADRDDVAIVAPADLTGSP